jgi:PAS domain S-box-containing protein
LGANHVARVERQLAVAQQLTHIGSWEWELATGHVTWSDELYRIYGLEPGSREIKLDFFLSRVHEGDRPLVQRGVATALERGGRFQWLERIVRPDGSVRELDTIGEALQDEAGRVTSLIGTCRDVTEERQRGQQIRLYADIVHNVQIGLSVWSVEEERDALSIRLLAFNPASERIAGMPLSPFLGRPFHEIAPYAAGGEVEALLACVARDGQVHEASVDRSRDPHHPTRALSIKGFPLPGQSVGLAIEDVTTQTVARRLQAAEHHILETIATGAPLGDSLAALVRAVEEHSPPVIGSVLLLDSDGVHLRHGVAPNLPEEYRLGIDGCAIGPRAGSCGTAVFRKQAVFVADVQTDPLWEDWRELACRHGLRACWSVPILATDQRVLGTFAFYYRAPRIPAESDLEITARASRLAGIAIERKQLEEQLRALSARMELALEDERTGIAREIHDELGQALTAIKMDLAWVLRRASSGDTLTRDELLAKMGAMSAFTDEVIGQVRRISSELRPGVLDDLGLVAAIEWQAQEFEERTDTTCVVRASSKEPAMDRQVSTAVFRIFQEALTNVTRHAEAQQVDVRIDVTDDAVCLEVRDDGKGITAEAARNPKSLGLVGIRERAHRLGGSVAVGPRVPRGTILSLRVPLVKGGGAR